MLCFENLYIVAMQCYNISLVLLKLLGSLRIFVDALFRVEQYVVILIKITHVHLVLMEMHSFHLCLLVKIGCLNFRQFTTLIIFFW